MIEGVGTFPLKKISDDRGAVLHMLKATDDHFEKFGEIYFSTINPGAVKGWNRHTEMILNFAVPSGQIKLVLFDDRSKSSTKGKLEEILIGESNYCLVKIPPMIWVSFQGLGSTPAILANCATLPHDPKETEKLDIFTDKIPYDWGIKKS